MNIFQINSLEAKAQKILTKINLPLNCPKTTPIPFIQLKSKNWTCSSPCEFPEFHKINFKTFSQNSEQKENKMSKKKAGPKSHLGVSSHGLPLPTIFRQTSANTTLTHLSPPPLKFSPFPWQFLSYPSESRIPTTVHSFGLICISFFNPQ